MRLSHFPTPPTFPPLFFHIMAIDSYFYKVFFILEEFGPGTLSVQQMAWLTWTLGLFMFLGPAVAKP